MDARNAIVVATGCCQPVTALRFMVVGPKIVSDITTPPAILRPLRMCLCLQSKQPVCNRIACVFLSVAPGPCSPVPSARDVVAASAAGALALSAAAQLPAGASAAGPAARHGVQHTQNHDGESPD